MGKYKTHSWFRGGLAQVSRDRSLQNYYLQQMGIEPWVLRSRVSGCALVVIVDELFGDTHELFNNMLQSIRLTQNDIILTEKKDVEICLKKFQPLAILSLGIFDGGSRGVTQMLHGLPLIVTHHPSYLLAHCQCKKESYDDLCLVAGILSGKNV